MALPASRPSSRPFGPSAMNLLRGPLPALLIATLVCSVQTAVADPFEFKRGDRVAIIGNTLAERMQHDGWLEAYLHTRFPDRELVFRNLAFPGDEVAGFTAAPDANKRLRSAAFGSSDEWLRRVEADVIFAFFGYNESFAGEAGLNKFKDELAAFIKHTTGQKYNGKSAPRLVLFSPVAHENLKDPNLPDGSENNKRIELYTAAMADVAKASQIAFVDVFHPTRDLYATATDPLTINGVHMTPKGNELVAREIDRSLFAGAPEPKRETVTTDKVRRAVVDKNFYWFHRYRTTDGYSIYGGRADLKFKNDQTNREVAQREMAVLDVMTANRDQRVWAVSRGGDLEVKDDNAPPFIPVITNKPGPLAGGKHLFLGGEEAIGHMKVAAGLKVNLFASEKEFPELVNPVQMAWDAKGRLWVAVWATYPHWKPKEEMNDKLLVFEDTDGDGKADKMTVFADRLHNPPGFEFFSGGVLIATPPDAVFQRRRQGRPADHGGRRHRFSRHPPHIEQLHPRPGRGPLFPGGDLPPHAGGDPLQRSRPLRQRRGLPLRATDAQVRRLRQLRIRQPARARLRPLGPGHRRGRDRGRAVSRGPVLRPPRLPEQAPPAAAGLQAVDAAVSRHGVPVEPPLPGLHERQSSRRQRDRLPGNPPVQDHRPGGQLHG